MGPFVLFLTVKCSYMKPSKLEGITRLLFHVAIEVTDEEKLLFRLNRNVLLRHLCVLLQVDQWHFFGRTITQYP